MRIKLLAAAIMAAAITSPACALAATVIESATIPEASVPYTYNFTLPSFNTSLGTLQSVEFELTDTSTGSVIVINTLGTAQSFSNASSSIPLTVTGPGGLSITDTITATAASGTVAANSNATFAGAPVTTSVNNTFTSGLSAFESGSVVNLSYLASAGAGTYGGTANSGVAFTGSGVAGGTFDIVYTYGSAVGSAAPEPATFALLMLGVGAIGGAMRSRRKAGLALTAA